MVIKSQKFTFLNKYLSLQNQRRQHEKPINDLQQKGFNFEKNSLCRILLLLLTVLLIVLFRHHIVCSIGFINCYITWPFASPTHVKIDLLHLSNDSTKHKYIPRRMHHILLGPLSLSPSPSWLVARNSCIQLHSNFEKHYYWTDENSQEFLQKNYPWFLKAWHSYKTYVQKADALRYFVLHFYGGIFLDMDLHCLHRLDELFNYLDNKVSSDKHLFFAVKAFPVGISNGFIIATRNHPLLQRAIQNLEFYNRNFILPHATIIISTGPMFISIQMQLNPSLWKSIFVLDGKENMIGGKTSTPIFKHLGSGSWHKADDIFFKNIPMQIQRQNQTFSLSIIVFIIFIFVVFIERKKKLFKVRLVFLISLPIFLPAVSQVLF